MVNFPRVKEILDGAIAGWKDRTGRNPKLDVHDSSFSWETREKLLNGKAFGRELIEDDKIGNSRGSETHLVVSLTTGVSPFRRMPSVGPYLSAEEIDEIVQWIDDGCPE